MYKGVRACAQGTFPLLIHRSECGDPEEGRESVLLLFLAVCGPSAPCFLCLEFPSAPKGKIGPSGDKELGDSSSPGCMSLPECVHKGAQGGEQGEAGGGEPGCRWGWLHRCKRQAGPPRPADPRSPGPLFQEPCRPAPHHFVCPAGPRTPGGQELLFCHPCIYLSTQLVSSRRARRNEDARRCSVHCAPGESLLLLYWVYRASSSQVLVRSANSRHLENSY